MQLPDSFRKPAQGGQNIFQAIETLLKNKEKQKQIEDYGYYTLDKPIDLMYGTATKSNDFERIQGDRDSMEYQGFYASPENNTLPMDQKQFGRQFNPQVLGQQAPELSQQYEQPLEAPVPQEQNVDPYAKYIILPQVQGRKRVEDIVPGEDVINRYVTNAKKWAGTVSADPKLTFRQKDTVAENAEYVGQYVEAVMRLAPYFDLPPKTMAAMIMEESGWGGQRFGGNLGGYGFLDSGEDLGIRFEANTIEEQAAKYLEKVASDWDGRYQGSRTPEDFHLKGYNPHKEYPAKVRSVMAMLEKQ